MNKLRAAGVAVLLLVPVVALPAHAAGPRPVVFTDSVTVEASRSGTVEVILPDDAKVSISAAVGDIAFEGAGRLVGVWLQKTDYTDFVTSYRLPAFAGGKQITYGSMPDPGCKAVPDDALPVTHDCTKATPSQSAVLHEGRYRLTVLADGPLRVTLRLHGLDGDPMTVATQRTIASTEQTLPVRETAGTQLVTFGKAATLGVPVQTFVVATAKGAGDSAFVESSTCTQPDDTQVPFAYGPQCIGGSSGSYQYRVGPGMGGGGFVYSSSEEGGGPVGLGGSFGDSGGVTFGQALGVWMART